MAGPEYCLVTVLSSICAREAIPACHNSAALKLLLSDVCLRAGRTGNIRRYQQHRRAFPAEGAPSTIALQDDCRTLCLCVRGPNCMLAHVDNQGLFHKIVMLLQRDAYQECACSCVASLSKDVCQQHILGAGETSHAEEAGDTGNTGLLPQLHSDA